MKLQGKTRRGPWAWAALLRIPNLLTVPGDVLAGFALTLPWRTGGFEDLVAAMAASLALYAAGLVMNDLVDEEADRTERPWRPIASGAISRDAARNAVGILLGFALVILALRNLSLLAAGIALGGLIFIYNYRARRTRLGGAAVIGSCRAASLLLGVVAAAPGRMPSVEAMVAAAWWGIFITAVGWLAARETAVRPYGRERRLPSLVVVAGALPALWLAAPDDGQAVFRGAFCFFFAFVLCHLAGIGMGIPRQMRAAGGQVVNRKDAMDYPASIGLMISALIPMQAGLMVTHAEEPAVLLAALLTLFLWPLNRWLAKRFAAS